MTTTGVRLWCICLCSQRLHGCISQLFVNRWSSEALLAVRMPTKDVHRPMCTVFTRSHFKELAKLHRIPTRSLRACKLMALGVPTENVFALCTAWETQDMYVMDNLMYGSPQMRADYILKILTERH